MGEELDAHRKAQEAAHPKLTLTGIYNVLEKLRPDTPLEGLDKEVFAQGLVGILRTLHDQIDAEVAAAYGWPANLSDDDILHRLVALNRERAAEEAMGLVRWLRPAYQNPNGTAATTTDGQSELDVGIASKIDRATWPKLLPAQLAVVRAALEELGEASPEQIARRFDRTRASAVQLLLQSLAIIGYAKEMDGGRYAP